MIREDNFVRLSAKSNEQNSVPSTSMRAVAASGYCHAGGVSRQFSENSIVGDGALFRYPADAVKARQFLDPFVQCACSLPLFRYPSLSIR